MPYPVLRCPVFFRGARPPPRARRTVPAHRKNSFHDCEADVRLKRWPCPLAFRIGLMRLREKTGVIWMES